MSRRALVLVAKDGWRLGLGAAGRRRAGMITRGRDRRKRTIRVRHAHGWPITKRGSVVGPRRSRSRPHSPELDRIELIAAADGFFLNFLVARLPAPVEEDLSKGILGTIDMDSYRVEKQGRD
jgi:hypothetical protein